MDATFAQSGADLRPDVAVVLLVRGDLLGIVLQQQRQPKRLHATGLRSRPSWSISISTTSPDRSVNGVSGTSAVPVDRITPSGNSSSRKRYSTSSSMRRLSSDV